MTIKEISTTANIDDLSMRLNSSNLIDYSMDSLEDLYNLYFQVGNNIILMVAYLPDLSDDTSLLSNDEYVEEVVSEELNNNGLDNVYVVQ